MENCSMLLLSLAILFTLTLAFISHFINSQRTKAKSPPGPKPWPIIGNLNLLGPIPHRSLDRLSRKYGEIMLLKFGKFPVVIASSPRMAEQFLKVHDANFASRPASAAGKHIGFNGSDVSFAPHGPYWRGARKIITSELLSTKKLESSERVRAEETCSFLSRLRDLAGEPVVLRDHLSRHTLLTVSMMVFRGKYLSDSAREEASVDVHELRGILKEWILLSGAFNVGDWIPWLGFLDLQGYVKRMKRLRGRMDRFFDLVIEDHLRERGEDDCAMKAFIEVLLQIAEDPNAEIQLTTDRVKALTMNSLLGGTETIATTVEWSILELLRQPRIIEKAKEELDRVIGRDRWVEEDDSPRLPYIDAILMETFRFHPLATLLTPRFATNNDCRVAGYDISKGTTVLVNAWSIGRDPSLWESPQEFLPERFMGRSVDTAASDFTLLPFGSGRRMCIGYNLGLKTLRTTLANLLHGFEPKLVEGMRPQDVSMEEQYGISTNPKHPLSIIFKPTLPQHLY